tara:strand:- start:1282 stop:2253 length:972 start_codon:yes stop_codon:yes gene_type:complete
MQKKNVDVAIIGAGGMGALFGAILFENGLEVVLIDNNEKHVEAINTEGLKIDDYDGVHTIEIPATSCYSDLESADLIFFQCKSYGTRDAARSARCFCRKDSACISFQNGLGNEEIIAEELGSEKVLGGLTTMAGMLLEPGRIRDFSRSASHPDGVPSYIGEMDGGLSERVTRIAEKLTRAGLQTHASDNIRLEIWKKLMGNIATGAISGLTNFTIATLLGVPELKDVSLQAIDEALEVAGACGIVLDREAVLKGLEMISIPGGTGDNKTSMCVDLLNQRPTELEFIYGKVIRFGEEKGIQTPTLKTLHALFKVAESKYLGNVG